ncbi:DNA repair protein RecO [Chengkuizengella axinellae]|uniref:DNA repair protein RecO n=1 Tax=Chengkuizengella axinellae TaxID=3064388 RepID=A0ABT9IUW1_9BACL|nr:DNA repair protein RecO [Chengkuizengella sp. 2205SS18-9]MDP5273102.1 DNA repair protein RecO [Chengkuizengella sp. 2205SS18-9]
MLYKVDGIVIRTIDYGEGNKIIVIYTKEMGKVSVMARGAKKLKSRLSSVTQLFTYAQYTYYKTGKMGTLNDVETLKSFHELNLDIFKSTYASYLVELVDRMLEEQEGSAYIFEQLVASLEFIQDDKDPQIITHIFELKMLELAGYYPVLTECISCGSDLNNSTFISASLGGTLCNKCSSKEQYVKKINARALKLLQVFQQMDIRRLGKINISDPIKNEIKMIMREFMDAHVNINFKSRYVLDQILNYHQK